MLQSDNEHGITSNKNTVKLKANNEQLCLFVNDHNKPEAGSKDENMADSTSKSKLASESTENDADMVRCDLTSKNSSNFNRELSTLSKLVV